MKLKDDKRCLIIKGKEGKDYQISSHQFCLDVIHDLVCLYHI